ncbi:MAG TPA: M20/M25/M40 family metallo-hydrolase [Longimicrobiales bacterium]
MQNSALVTAATLALLTGSAAGQSTSPRYQREIAGLMEHPAIQRAFGAVLELEPSTHATLLELTEIPAPPFMEEARGRRFAELLAEAGADSVWTDAVGNVIGLRRGRGGARTVALDGHLDTVFPEGTDVTVRVRGDTLFAPGIGDDTRGLAVVLAVLRALEQAGVETEADLLFVGTVGEEGLGDLRGMKHLFREGAEPIDAWIAIDGGDLDRLITMGLGSVRYRTTFKGPGGHSWGAFGLPNPVHAMARGVRYFQDAADTLTRKGPITSYNVGRIGGGTSVNSVPFEAWMEVDMRSESPASLTGIEAAFVAAMRRALVEENLLRREGPPLTLDNARIGDRPSGELDPDVPLIQRALAATRAVGGVPEVGRSSTNANVPIALGVPAITLGRGGVGDLGHAPGEWWLNRDGHLAIQRALLVVVAEAGLAGIVG